MIFSALLAADVPALCFHSCKIWHADSQPIVAGGGGGGAVGGAGGLGWAGLGWAGLG